MTRTEEQLYIYAASSLDRFVTKLNHRYQELYPHMKVTVSLVGSQTARLQLERGAPPGIYLSADPSHIEVLSVSGKVIKSQRIATNRISLFTQTQSTVYGLDDLESGQGFAIGSEQVPVGRYSWTLLREYFKDNQEALLRLTPLIKTQEVSARALRARLLRAEVESAFLYHSDKIGLKGVREIEIPKRLLPLTTVEITIAMTRQSLRGFASKPAQDWYHLATSDLGVHSLRASGLSPIIERNESQHQR